MFYATLQYTRRSHGSVHFCKLSIQDTAGWKHYTLSWKITNTSYKKALVTVTSVTTYNPTDVTACSTGNSGDSDKELC
jgi:hypothetical protein